MIERSRSGLEEEDQNYNFKKHIMMMMIVVIVTQLNKYFSGQCVHFCPKPEMSHCNCSQDKPDMISIDINR